MSKEDKKQNSSNVATKAEAEYYNKKLALIVGGDRKDVSEEYLKSLTRKMYKNLRGK